MVMVQKLPFMRTENIVMVEVGGDKQECNDTTRVFHQQEGKVAIGN